MNEKLEALNQEIEKTEKKLRRAQHEEKILEHQIKTLIRKERTHRLCTRAAMLESYLPHPEAITDEQVSVFLKLLFHKDKHPPAYGKSIRRKRHREGGRRMKMNFSKDDLAMVYQYAAGTKEETLAGLKEFVPVIRDRLRQREIVESTIRKLDAIPEPECRRFIADTKQRFIQKRDHSIRRRLAEAKARRGRKSHIPREKSQTGNGHNRFQSRSPWTAL